MAVRRRSPRVLASAVAVSMSAGSPSRMSSARGWRWIRDNDPDGWAEAVEFDRAIRHGHPRATAQGQPLRGRYYLHRSCIPLDQVDLDAPAKRKRHLPLLTDDSVEAADPDGCSPWSCRSGASVDADEAA